MALSSEWIEGIFGDGGIGLGYSPLYVLTAVILALPSSLWSRYVGRREWIGWAVSIAAAIVLLLLNQGLWVWAGLWVVMPQHLAFPLTRNRPWRRPFVAAGLSVVGVLLLVVPAILLGATSN